jgi:hypothetical protein
LRAVRLAAIVHALAWRAEEVVAPLEEIDAADGPGPLRRDGRWGRGEKASGQVTHDDGVVTDSSIANARFTRGTAWGRGSP